MEQIKKERGISNSTANNVPRRKTDSAEMIIFSAALCSGNPPARKLDLSEKGTLSLVAAAGGRWAGQQGIDAGEQVEGRHFIAIQQHS